MTEPLVDLRGLREHQVDYVLFGALAMVFYGFVRSPEDLGIVVAPDEENLDRVAEWLMSIEAVLKLNPRRRLGPRERWGMDKGSNAPAAQPRSYPLASPEDEAAFCSQGGRKRSDPVMGRMSLRRN